jgi:hypothetical protein
MSAIGFPVAKPGQAATPEILRETELLLSPAAPVTKQPETAQKPESQSALSPQNFYVRPNDHKTITQPVVD